MIQVNNIKLFLHKIFLNISPSYRKIVQQSKKVTSLEKRMVELNSSLLKMSKNINLINTSFENNVSAVYNVEKKLGTIHQKIGNLYYDKSEYFEIDSELGVFTISNFRKYIEDNKDTVDKDIEILKEALDKESHDAVDLFLERIQYFLPEKLPGNLPILYKKEGLFTEGELLPYSTGKVSAKAKSFRSKYDIGNKKTFLCPIYYESGLYFLGDKIKKQIEGSIAIDCGAYWGDTAIVFSEYSPKKVYAFEPVDYWYDEMVSIIAKNKLDEIIVPIKIGVSDTDSQLFYTESDTTSFLSDSADGTSCEVTSIDRFLESTDERVGLIKYDVEGLDFLALKGSIETIKKYKPILLTSIYHEPEHFLQIKPYLDSLNLGYKHKIRKLAKSPLCDVLLISWVDEDR